jgi:L-fuculokinase
MPAQPVIAVFDIGKTNKKLLLFDQDYRVVEQHATQLPETVDEGGDPCEDLAALTRWVDQSFTEVMARTDIAVKAVNVSAYGASFVYLGEGGEVLAPLYNYLKPYPEDLLERFFSTFGGQEKIASETASPVLGSLNSGLQLYRLKHEQPVLFKKIRYALHLPQYVSYVLSQKAVTELTSVGCHTMLWDFEGGDYHGWVSREGLLGKFAPLTPATEATVVAYQSKTIHIGVGLHDSSSALIPYLASFGEPFVLLSTGTWCISLNPFNHTPLTPEELQQDCLCYLSYRGTPVKAARLFAGHQHEQGVKRLAEHYGKEGGYYKRVALQAELLREEEQASNQPFSEKDLADYTTYEEAYHLLVQDLATQQVAALKQVLTGSEKRLFVDGGFSQNPIFMHLLANAFPHLDVYAASVAQASALGAALAIHNSWNEKPTPQKLIELKDYTGTHNTVL